MNLTLDEVRRLTGPNLLSDMPGAIIDVLYSDVEPSEVLACFKSKIQRCQDAMGWREQVFHRYYTGGLSVSISAPMDLLYSACDLLELAWDLCVEELSQNSSPSIPFEERLSALKDTIADEQNPKLIAIMDEASAHNVICLVDDDELSLGDGPSSQTWPIDKLPSIESINWAAYSSIPLGLITGTNGKSTSVRLAAEIAKSAGLAAGVTSTDFIKVGDTIIDEGDYSGPGGARMLLRDKRTEIAFLEVARGGILRRGLPVYEAKAALITNVASDHLGQYGINTVDEIAQVKSMVGKAINDTGMLVLNADDHRLVDYSRHFSIPICWFSMNPNHPLILEAIKTETSCVFVDDGYFVFQDTVRSEILAVSDAPMTLGASAAHNVQNALGVIGLCKAMGLNNDAIKQGLLRFGSNAEDNPGRGNLYDVNGIKVIVDFAHNSHSMQAVVAMASRIPAQNKHVLFSHAGDRSDSDMKDVADVVMRLEPHTYVLAEIEQYLRGRAVNEISELVQTHLVSRGVDKNTIMIAPDPVSGSKKVMEQASPGDLVLLFILSDRQRVQDYLLDLADA